MEKKSGQIDKQHRYPWAVIETAVKLNLGNHLTYRSVSEKMLEMGIVVSHKTIYEWVQKFQDSVEIKHKRRPSHYEIEETQEKCNGNLVYMYRAINSKNSTLGVYLREKKNLVAAKNFFKKTIELPA